MVGLLWNKTAVVGTQETSVGNGHEGESLDIVRLGRRLRDLRSAHELSLESLARASGISPSLLSQVERGKVTPSLTTLHALGQALNTPMFELFGSPRDQLSVTTRGNRRAIRPPGSDGVTYQMVSTTALNQLQVIEMVIDGESGNFDHSLSHAGEECVLALEGTALVEIDEETVELDAGDAVSFAARLPHRFNASNGSVRLIVSMSPPAF
jgi:transcriptional regulator with XRE-family HTH domain